MFDLKPKALHYWYKDTLSGYAEAKAIGQWGNIAVMDVDVMTGEVTAQTDVPIAKTENFGTHMTVDEKQIGKQMYNVMTNAHTGKIALLGPTMQPQQFATDCNNLSARCR